MMGNARKAGPFARFLGDRSGANIIEAAVAFPVFILMLVGVIEMAMLMFVQIAVEGGLREASRFGITGAAAEEGKTREQKIVEIVQEHAQNLVDIEAGDVEMLVYTDFSSVGQPEPYTDANPNDGPDFKEGVDTFTPDLHDINGNGVWDADQGDSGQGAGATAAVVLYRVTFQWSWLTPLPALVSLAAGGADSSLPDQITLEASMVVRNEPWPEEEE